MPILNSVGSNDLELLSKIFNDKKGRAVYLRQLSFLFVDTLYTRDLGNLHVGLLDL